VGKPEGTRPLGTPGLREIGWGNRDRVLLVQDRYQWRAIVNTAMNLWVL
jgi:hypothetical protein